jgi:hypothetical protein
MIYAAYTGAVPAVHTKVLGRNKFAAMLGAVYPNIGPHRNGACTVSEVYLLR